MQLKDVDYSSWRWIESNAFMKWLYNNSKWEDAEIVATEIDWKEFQKQHKASYYVYREFIIKRKNKLYYFFIYEKERPYGDIGVLLKKKYAEGEEPIRRKRKYSTYKYEYTSNVVEIKHKVLKNSCQIWALACLLSISYEEAHKILAEEGWSEYKTYNAERRWKKALEKIEVSFIPVWSRWNKKKGYSLKNVFQIVPKKGRFLIFISGHVLSVIDGIIYDNKYSSPYCHIEKVFKIGE